MFASIRSFDAKAVSSDRRSRLSTATALDGRRPSRARGLPRRATLARRASGFRALMLGASGCGTDPAAPPASFSGPSGLVSPQAREGGTSSGRTAGRSGIGQRPLPSLAIQGKARRMTKPIRWATSITRRGSGQGRGSRRGRAPRLAQGPCARRMPAPRSRSLCRCSISANSEEKTRRAILLPALSLTGSERPPSSPPWAGPYRSKAAPSSRVAAFFFERGLQWAAGALRADGPGSEVLEPELIREDRSLFLVALPDAPSFYPIGRQVRHLGIPP
ncbi:hypothetical protein J2Z33_002155 [Rubellimicrobium aerolatum]|nr:hypothetical protein [Rubellimicrobium aerolatum]